MSAACSSTLVLGGSGTGKTFYAVSMTRGSPLPKYVVNASVDDFPTSYVHLELDSVLDLSQGILIIDDIIRPSDAECKIMNEALVRIKRHCHVKMFFLSHNIQKNGLHSLLAHFDFVTFPHSVKNMNCFLSYARKYCPKSMDECRRVWDHFIEEKNRDKYLRYDVSDAKFEITDATGFVLITRQSDLRQKIERFIKPFGNLDESLALLDYLFASLPENSVSENMILYMTGVKSARPMHVNIIDLIWCVSDSNHGKPPDKNIILAFRALQKLYLIPHLFIKNDWFRQSHGGEVMRRSSSSSSQESE